MSLQINENSSSDDIKNDAAIESAVIHDESSTTNHKQNEKLSTDTTAKLESIHEEETAASSNTTEPTEKYDLNIFLGRWVLVDSQVSTPLVKVIRAEMIMTPLGDDEYTIQDTWTESVCWCYRRTYKTTSIGKDTGPDSFIETNVKTGNVEYGRKVRVRLFYIMNACVHYKVSMTWLFYLALVCLLSSLQTECTNICYYHLSSSS